MSHYVAIQSASQALILRSEFPAPSHRIHIRTADIEDVAIVGHKLDQIFKMAREAVRDHLEHLRERTPP